MVRSYVGLRCGVVVRTSDYRLWEPWRIDPWARLVALHCSSSLSWMNKHLATDNCWYIYEEVRALIVAWLDASQNSRDGVRLNRSAGEYNVKRLKIHQCCELDAAVYQNSTHVIVRPNHCSESALESTFQNENVQPRLNYWAIILFNSGIQSFKWPGTMESEQTYKYNLALSSKQQNRIVILTFSIDVFFILPHDAP